MSDFKISTGKKERLYHDCCVYWGEKKREKELDKKILNKIVFRSI